MKSPTVPTSALPSLPAPSDHFHSLPYVQMSSTPLHGVHELGNGQLWNVFWPPNPFFVGRKAGGIMNAVGSRIAILWAIASAWFVLLCLPLLPSVILQRAPPEGVFVAEVQVRRFRRWGGCEVFFNFFFLDNSNLFRG